MRPIPTPRTFAKSVETAPLTSIRMISGVSENETVRWGIGEVCRIFRYPDPSGAELTLQYGEDPFFEEKNAAGQGYILTREGNRITLRAQSTIGFLYGLMTLCNLCGDAPAAFTVKDRPQIRFRGNMNTLWAETGVWSYDFGDGTEAARQRLFRALDDMAHAKLNLMYVDAFGFSTERFQGYNAMMKEISEYARVRGIRTMAGGYGMGYGQSGQGGNGFMGKVFRNRRPYPGGALYDCIGTCGSSDSQPVSELMGRSFGTCLSNDALTDDKASEIGEYLEKTGVSVLYLHNMDSDELHAPLWRGRCLNCRKRWPSDSLYAPDGAAGAFAAFYDRLIEKLISVCPELIVCPVSPGYAYAVSTGDADFETSRRFWSSVVGYMKNSQHVMPVFREQFCSHDGKRLRFDMLRESFGEREFGCVFFSGGDGFYSDRPYVPSAALAGTMREADMILCANGGALQKPVQYANAEYLWNPDGSAFWQAEPVNVFGDFMRRYDDLRGGVMRPEGIYGKNGLLESSCRILFGEKAGKSMADLYRLRGKNGEPVLFTACSVEINTQRTRSGFRMRWDVPLERDAIERYRERFAETALVTQEGAELLSALLGSGGVRSEDTGYYRFLRDSCETNARLCRCLARYMDLYREADFCFAERKKPEAGFEESAIVLIGKAEAQRERFREDNCRPFDPMGGALQKRDEAFEFIAYQTGLILQSLHTGKRIPEDRRPEKEWLWW